VTDSAGLTAPLVALKRTQGDSGALHLVVPKVVDVSGLKGTFSIHRSLLEAVSVAS
jgi:hypothetical protein